MSNLIDSLTLHLPLARSRCMSKKLQSTNEETMVSLCSPENLVVTRVVAGQAIGNKPQTTYNQIYRKCYPLPVVLVGGRKMVRVSDLLEYVANLKPIPAPPSPKKRGRPSNANKSAMTATRGGI